MSERLPSGHRFYDAEGLGWTWADDVPLNWQDQHDDDAADEPIDFDAVPTQQELEAGETGGVVVSLIDEPHAIALPEIYEPGYAYPVIVWFHAAGGSEDDVFPALSEISERNYLAVALRGDRLGEAGAEWSTAETSASVLADKLEGLLDRMGTKFAIQRDRVYLAGVGSGGTTALELLLERPESFAGAACLGGAFPALAQPLAKFRGLRGRRVLLSTTLDCTDVKVVDMVDAGRILYSAGMSVGTRIYKQSEELPSSKMFRDIDHWIMDGIASAVRVES